jgi:hypothetical protein
MLGHPMLCQPPLVSTSFANRTIYKSLETVPNQIPTD